MPQVALIIRDLWKAHINPKCSWETRGLFFPATGQGLWPASLPNRQEGKEANDPVRYLPASILKQQGWSIVAIGVVCPFSHWARSEIQGNQLFSLIMKILIS